MDYKNGTGDGNKIFLFYYRGQSALYVHHNNNLKRYIGLSVLLDKQCQRVR